METGESSATLASLNVVPFLGLMNLLEVKYMHIPEVYRTVLAILCDYNPLEQNNVVRTRHYLKVLLSREQELAQCLLSFIDEPQDTKSSPLLGRKKNVSSDLSSSHCQPSTSDSSSPSSEKKVTESAQDTHFKKGDTVIRPASHLEDGCDIFLAAQSTCSTAWQQNPNKQSAHYVPVINIQHRSLGSSLKNTSGTSNQMCASISSASSSSSVHQQQSLSKDIHGELDFFKQNLSLIPIKSKNNRFATLSTAPLSSTPSELLGQPDLAYNPLSQYLDSSCSLHEFGPKEDKMGTYISPLFDSNKASSASAKLRLLSTKAGSDRHGLAQAADPGKTTAAMTTTLKSLSVQMLSSEKYRLKDEVSEAKTDKTDNPRQYTKILPAACFDYITETCSNDKQVQVGRCQVNKRPQTKEGKQLTFLDMPTLQTELKFIPFRKFSTDDKVGHGASCESESRMQLAKETGVDGSKSEPGDQNSERIETAAKPDPKKCPIDGSGKRVQVVEVCIGAANSSLSVFPYIQQMVLPENDACTVSSTKSQNTTSLVTSAGATKNKPFQISGKPFIGCPSASRAARPKPTTQIIFPKNQAQPSLSIQASGTKYHSFTKQVLSGSTTSTVASSSNKFKPSATPEPVLPKSDGPEKAVTAQEEANPLSVINNLDVQLKRKKRRATSSGTRLTLKKKCKKIMDTAVTE